MFSWLDRLRQAAPARLAAAPPQSPQGLPDAATSVAQPQGPDQTSLDPEQLLQQLEWTVLRRLDGQLQGDYRNLLRGAGLELADLREYMAHDDVRHIDWNVTARMQTPYVREHQEDREVSAWFVIDLSGSLDFGSSQMSKRQLACSAVAVLSRLLVRHGNRVGALICSGREVRAEVVMPARSGRRHVMELMRRILNTPARTRGQTTDLRTLLLQAHQVIRRRSLVFVVSDFISQPGWQTALGPLAQRHEVVAMRLRDPLEMQLPDLGMVWIEDAETGEQLFVDVHDRGLRQRFAEQADARETVLQQALAHAGVDCLELHTDEELDRSLLRFTALRKRSQQITAGVSRSAVWRQRAGSEHA